MLRDLYLAFKTNMEDEMDRRTFVITMPAIVVTTGMTSGVSQTQETVDLKVISLPKPEKDGGLSVLAALQHRKTTRDISDKKLTRQTLSNLLWAAFGVNRKTVMFVIFESGCLAVEEF